MAIEFYFKLNFKRRTDKRKKKQNVIITMLRNRKKLLAFLYNFIYNFSTILNSNKEYDFALLFATQTLGKISQVSTTL